MAGAWARARLGAGVLALVALFDAPAVAGSTSTTSTLARTAAAPSAVSPVRAAACQGTLVASTLGSVVSPDVRELSGIAASRRNAGVWWVHNDSGDKPRVFAIDFSGRDLGTFDLSPATHVDWEAIAVGPGPVARTQYLYVGDIGDNNRARGSIAVYRVPEPTVDPATAGPGTTKLGGVAKLVLKYPGGAKYDAEALFLDPVAVQLFVVTKDSNGTARVFRAPAKSAPGTTAVMTQVATLSLGAFQMVTGADITPSGDVVALRTYLSVFLFPRPKGSAAEAAFSQRRCDGAAPGDVFSQYESIGFTSDGRGYVTASEGANPALRRYRAP